MSLAGVSMALALRMLASTTPLAPALSSASMPAGVEDTYDRFVDQTTITTELTLHEAPNERTRFALMVVFDGQRMPPPDRVFILPVIVAMNEDGRRHGFESRIDILAHADTEDEVDPEPVRGSYEVLGYRPDIDFVGPGLRTRAVYTEIVVFEETDLAFWREAASKPNLVLRIDGDVFELGEGQIAQLRAYLDHLEARSDADADGPAAKTP
jgi:hypothetical protein